MTTATIYSYQTVTAVTSYSTSRNVPTGAIQLTPAGGVTAHDIWLVIAPLQEGQFAIILSAQGLQQSGSYLIEGVTRGAQMTPVPFATTAADSEFVSDAHGNGVYWHVVSSDPRLMYWQVLLLYLPNAQLQGSQLVASAFLS
jgi:hypothetical protein